MLGNFHAFVVVCQDKQTNSEEQDLTVSNQTIIPVFAIPRLKPCPAGYICTKLLPNFYPCKIPVISMYLQSKKEGKLQESIQSCTTTSRVVNSVDKTGFTLTGFKL